jgi:hypothetical protein
MTTTFGSPWISIIAAIAALYATVLLCSRRGSMGFPVAYMANLLLLHVPGAYAYTVAGDRYGDLFMGRATPVGMELTAIGAACFVGGLWFARRKLVGTEIRRLNTDPKFVTFCLVGGWLFAFGLTPLRGIPSLGAAIVFGSSVWMIGVMLGMDRAFADRRWDKVLLWLLAMLVYPAVVLIFGGFLSYGSAAIIIVLSFAMVRARRRWIALALMPVLFFFGISVFVNYFEQRTFLRGVLWSEANFEERVDALKQAFSGFKLFDPNDEQQVAALSMRLNQNAFVGVAARRLDRGDLQYFRGRSFYEGLEALVPRALWADKPVYGGSPGIVIEVTGLRLNQDTSWGVGNVLEFYVNFGYWSLTIGFLLLGWAIGRLDIIGYRRLSTGRLADSLVVILPGIALIQPNGSLVEITGGAAAALIAALFWRHVWRQVAGQKIRQSVIRHSQLRPAAPNSRVAGRRYR